MMFTLINIMYSILLIIVEPYRSALNNIKEIIINLLMSLLGIILFVRTIIYPKSNEA